MERRNEGEVCGRRAEGETCFWHSRLVAGDTARLTRAALSAAWAVSTSPLMLGTDWLLGFRGSGGLGSSFLQRVPALAERSQRARLASRADSRKESGDEERRYWELVAEARRTRAAAPWLRLRTSVIDVQTADVRPAGVPDRCADSDRR